MHACLFVVVDVDVVVDDDDVVSEAFVTVDVDDATITNAHAIADGDDACSDATTFAQCI
jgi:hypothetical protein